MVEPDIRPWKRRGRKTRHRVASGLLSCGPVVARRGVAQFAGRVVDAEPVSPCLQGDRSSRHFLIRLPKGPPRCRTSDS